MTPKTFRSRDEGDLNSRSSTDADGEERYMGREFGVGFLFTDLSPKRGIFAR